MSEFPAWLEAISTAVGALAAILALYFAVKNYLKDRSDTQHQIDSMNKQLKLNTELDIKDETALKSFKELYKSCDDINTERNKYMHSMHLKPDNEEQIFRISTKLKNYMFQSDKVSIELIDKVNADIFECLDKIEDFRSKYSGNKLFMNSTDEVKFI